LDIQPAGKRLDDLPAKVEANVETGRIRYRLGNLEVSTPASAKLFSESY
jgi:hypothetical protein